MSLLQLAREASGDLHRQIEKTPLATALAASTVDRETYARLMAAMAVVHEAVEGNLHAEGLAFERRENVALGDCQALGGAAEEDFEALATWKEALSLAGSDWAWVGALYVLEGSKMGSRMLLGTIAKALGVPAEPGRGVDYHLAAVADRGQSWTRFKTFLESSEPDADDRAAYAEGVRRTFQMMVELYGELSASPAAAVV